MPINILCPVCHEPHHLHEDMIGKRMRCVNRLCREVFEVKDPAAVPPAKPPAPVPARAADSPADAKGYVTGTVGQIVPLLTSAAAEEAAPVQAPNVPSASVGTAVPLLAAEIAEPVQTPKAEAIPWQQALPPVRRAEAAPEPAAPLPSEARSRATGKRPVPPKTQPPPEAPAEPAPREVAAGNWEAPPVRRGGDAVPSVPAPAEAPATPLVVPPPATQRFGKVVIACCLLLVVGLGTWAFLGMKKDNPEEALRQKAEAAYNDGDYRTAAELYGKLAKAVPDGEQHAEDEFRRDLCLLLAEATMAVVEVERRMEDFRKFLREQEADAVKKRLLEQHKSKVQELQRALIERALDDVEKRSLTTESERIEKELARDEAWIEEGKPYWVDGTPPRGYRERIDALRKKLVQENRRNGFLAKLRDLLRGKPTLRDVKIAEDVARHEKLEDDPEVRKLLAELVQRAVPSIEYVQAPKAPLPPEYNPPTLLVAPSLGPNPTGVPGQGMAFALARGVLYALNADNGKVVWATRVGIDTTQLPVRLPATAILPEMVLVLSADTNTLTARRVSDGAGLWQHNLGAPSLGRPLIVERELAQGEGESRLSRRAYVPTVDGRVQEIEIVSGHLLGEYRCGLPLRVGGARQPGTSLLYFPADHGFVFVLDVARQNCLTVLRTGHPSGSLRSEPIVVADEQANPDLPNAPPRCLVLCQTAGLEKMKLRAWSFTNDWKSFDDKPPLEQELRGWSWFAPTVDPEKIALATDAGLLGLFGLNQKNNRDPPLFPLLGKDRDIRLQGSGEGSGQAQVVLATESDFWVLANGELQRWHLGLDPMQGQRLSPVWSRTVPLGASLQAGQTSPSPTGEVLCVVTQNATRQTCLATALDAGTGTIRWQRQLGFVCAADPLALGGQVLALDRDGSLFLFDAGKQGQIVQEEVRARPAEPVTGTPLVQPASDGSVTIFNTLGTDRLLVRRFTPGAKPGERGSLEDITLKAALRGTPALGGGQLVVPLANGTLLRQGPGKNASPDYGPEWRADHADAGSPGHVVHLGGADFLCTDGSHGLQRLTWPLGMRWQQKELKLPPLGRLVAAPVLLPRENEKTPLRIVVADAGGLVTLLQGDALQKDRSWKLAGAITAGPFLRGAFLGCVLEHRRLVWIDPNRDEPLWTHGQPEGARIIGQPQLIGTNIVVATQDGRLVALDVASGKPLGAGHRIRASVVPAAAPTTFGPDRLFAPLTDGTVLLLPLKELEQP